MQMQLYIIKLYNKYLFYLPTYSKSVVLFDFKMYNSSVLVRATQNLLKGHIHR